jgi:uncharacterized protein YjbI with pentapeptide repeats
MSHVLDEYISPLRLITDIVISNKLSHKQVGGVSEAEQVEAIKGGVASWNQWKAANPRKRPDLRGAHLTGLSLEGINLNGARLAEVDFEFCNLKKANFAGADLSRANLSNTDLTDAVFLNANLQGARLTGATVTRADFRGANVAGADIRQIKRGL